jgi:hypothetical protein
MLERINERLRAEGIRPVEMIILKWRVSQLLRDIQRKFCKCKRTSLYTCASKHVERAAACNAQLANYIECLAEGDMLRGITVAGSGSGSQLQVQTQSDNTSQQSSSPQRSEHSPSESRPYDPIRDV